MSYVRADLVTCPYDSSHRILRERIVRHLIKCRDNNKPQSLVMVECPINKNHIVREMEMHYHLINCSKNTTKSYYYWLKQYNTTKC